MSKEIFYLENDDYMWLGILHGEANAQSIKRGRLNEWALKYGIEPSKYKNKKLLIKTMMEVWEGYFFENQEFKKAYETKYHGEPIPDNLPPKSEWP